MIGYKSLGGGEHNVLMLHGWFGDETSFAPMQDALSLGEFTYAVMAYRGYGASRQQRGDYSIAEIAAAALDLADALEWDTFSLVGHSMGGMAAQRVLADAPQRVRKIVAITPVPASGVAELDRPHRPPLRRGRHGRGVCRLSAELGQDRFQRGHQGQPGADQGHCRRA